MGVYFVLTTVCSGVQPSPPSCKGILAISGLSEANDEGSFETSPLQIFELQMYATKILQQQTS